MQGGSCPDCRGFIFRDGPRGGISQNIECVGCGSRFNVVRYFDHIVRVERLPREREGGGKWREDMFPRVLQ
ncbi:hypothetical protein [Bradyrhizobium sp. BRP22]|uniref:hypothetical protein n=1 Tax=Bradyrhizobium sp. BRP22 TaxID=2793821 RepID=UPI001CD534DC|nr:hypothetical protein [Bradyrhizobium sp. BRP22]